MLQVLLNSEFTVTGFRSVVVGSERGLLGASTPTSSRKCMLAPSTSFSIINFCGIENNGTSDDVLSTRCDSEFKLFHEICLLTGEREIYVNFNGFRNHFDEAKGGTSAQFSFVWGNFPFVRVHLNEI